MLDPKWARLGPGRVPWAETEKWPYLGLQGRNRSSKDTFSTCNPPLWVVSTPQNDPNGPLKVVFGHQVPVWPYFSGILARDEKRPKMVKNGSKLPFSKNDSGPFGVPLGVILTRFE